MGDLDGKHILVTGANTGIGRATVLALAARGADVTLACRNEDKTRPVLDELRRAHPEVGVHFLKLDLGNLAATRTAALAFLDTGRPIDVLVNNAGLAGVQAMTDDGLEKTVGTNHIGHYLFTALLLPRLRQSSGARLVNVASNGSLRVKAVNWDHVRTPAASALESFDRYCLSKLFNVIHARELARRLSEDSPGAHRVLTASLHPGAVASDVWREVPNPFRWLLSLVLLSNEDGAKTTLHCATAADIVSGGYYDACKPHRGNRLADDAALTERLFTWSDEVVASFLRGA